jgi:hypothetical protein
MAISPAARVSGGKIIEITKARVVPAEGAVPFPPTVAIYKRTIRQLPHRTAAYIVCKMPMMHLGPSLSRRPRNRNTKHRTRPSDPNYFHDSSPFPRARRAKGRHCTYQNNKKSFSPRWLELYIFSMSRCTPSGVRRLHLAGQSPTADLAALDLARCNSKPCKALDLLAEFIDMWLRLAVLGIGGGFVIGMLFVMQFCILSVRIRYCR